MAEKDTQVKPGIKTFLGWVRDSYLYFADNRAEMWRDHEMYDGLQWSTDQVAKLKDMLGMQALTINRTFPTINMLLGMQALGKVDIVAKGRTMQDTDVTPLATESLKFVLEQNEGYAKVAEAFRGSVIPGFSSIEILKNPDPRKEVVKLAFREWNQLWWDPHGTPWFDTDTTRYVFLQKWVDLHDLEGLFPKLKREIDDYYHGGGSNLNDPYTLGYVDYDPVWQEFQDKQEFWKNVVWVDRQRKRVLPTQLWYTQRSEILFALFRDGRAIEIPDDMPLNEQYNLITSAQEIIRSYVPKMRVATFLGELLLNDDTTPHNHDEFPFAPFVGYIDRFKRPYGVPRQIRDMDIEVNKRRTTALAKLNARRVIVEDGAVEDLSELRAEATRPDGLIVVRRGKAEMIKIEDHNTDLQGQIALLHESEREIGETSGAVAEQLGIESNAVSGIAIQRRQQKGATITAPIFENLRRSRHRIGYLALSAMQQHWQNEKVIRITDRMRGIDKLLVINERVKGPAGEYVIKNRFHDVKFDIHVMDDTFNDLMREKYAEILIETTKRAAPEAVPQVLDVAFELLDLPKKEFLLARLRQAFGLEIPPDEDMSKEEIAKQVQAKKAEEAKKIERAQNLQFEEQELQNEKLIAQIRKLLKQAEVAEAQVDKIEAETELSIVDADREDERIVREYDDKARNREVKSRLEEEKIKAQSKRLQVAKPKQQPKKGAK